MTKKNKTIVKFGRGGTIHVNNSEGYEEVGISHHSGSNIKLLNNITSELATNNKQTLIKGDNFETVLGDKLTAVEGFKQDRINGDVVLTIGSNQTFNTEVQTEWLKQAAPVAMARATPELTRGGITNIAGIEHAEKGKRIDNPMIVKFDNRVEKAPSFSLSIAYEELYEMLERTATSIETEKIPEEVEPDEPLFEEPIDAINSFSNRSFTEESDSTEGGEYEVDPVHENIEEVYEKTQEVLTEYEKALGAGGMHINNIGRNVSVFVGAGTNTYDSLIIDPVGKLEQTSNLITPDAVVAHEEGISHAEVIDNDSFVPFGNYSIACGNKLDITTGSGGVNVNTCGNSTFVSGGQLFMGGKHVLIGSESNVRVKAKDAVHIEGKHVLLNAQTGQTFIQQSAGVQNNLTVGGGLYVDGDAVLQSVTAPVEIKVTDTAVNPENYNELPKVDFKEFGGGADEMQLMFAEKSEVTIAGNVSIDNVLNPFTATFDLHDFSPFTVKMPHAHTFPSIPTQFVDGSQGVRLIAAESGINNNSVKVQPRNVQHLTGTKDVVVREQD